MKSKATSLMAKSTSKGEICSRRINKCLIKNKFPLIEPCKRRELINIVIFLINRGGCIKTCQWHKIIAHTQRTNYKFFRFSFHRSLKFVIVIELHHFLEHPCLLKPSILWCILLFVLLQSNKNFPSSCQKMVDADLGKTLLNKLNITPCCYKYSILSHNNNPYALEYAFTHLEHS